MTRRSLFVVLEACFRISRSARGTRGATGDSAASTDESKRLALFQQVQRLVAREVPYISLWYKTNVAVAQRTLTGVHLTPLADFQFLKDVARVQASAGN